jgi:hypothetical protein
MDKVMATIAKTMEAGVPFLVPRITENHVRLMHAVIGYLGTATVPTVQVNSLHKVWVAAKDADYDFLTDNRKVENRAYRSWQNLIRRGVGHEDIGGGG